MKALLPVKSQFLISLIIWLSLITSVSAQINYDFTGNLDTQFTYLTMDSTLFPIDKMQWSTTGLVNLALTDKAEKSPWDAWVGAQFGARDLHQDGEGGVHWQPYRAWLRYRGEKLEVRLGRQKLVYGHAYVLRPMALFDQINPTDFTKRTPGVKALRLRWFPDQKTGVHSWLMENDKNKNQPHKGVRVNRVFAKGEVAFTLHQWEDRFPLPEEKILGFDAFFDVGPGLWLEHATHQLKNLPDINVTTVGMDTTIATIGNGLHVGLELMETRDVRWKSQSHARSFFFDIPLNDEQNLAGVYLEESVTKIKFAQVRWLKDVDDNTNLEISWQWLNQDYDTLRRLPTPYPMVQGIGIRVYRVF